MYIYIYIYIHTVVRSAQRAKITKISSIHLYRKLG